MSPEFSPQLRQKIDEIISHYPKKEVALLPILQLIQQEFGFISSENERGVAKILGIPPVRVREVVSFYTMLYRMPLGRYHIQVCSNLSCTLLGGKDLLSHLEEKLGIKPGETTADGKFSISTVECLGACEQAPCMMVNFDYFGNLSEERVDEIMARLK